MGKLLIECGLIEGAADGKLGPPDRTATTMGVGEWVRAAELVWQANLPCLLLLARNGLISRVAPSKSGHIQCTNTRTSRPNSACVCLSRIRGIYTMHYNGICVLRRGIHHSACLECVKCVCDCACVVGLCSGLPKMLAHFFACDAKVFSRS